MTVPSGETSTAPMQHGHCPHCGTSLDGPPIWQYYMDLHGDPGLADRYTKGFGATRDHGRFGLQITEIDLWLDKVVEIRCPKRNSTAPR